MYVFKYINLTVFLISFAFGIFAVYVTTSPMRKIVVYPTPDNLDKVQYKDDTDTCFVYKQEKVKCPANKNDIYKVLPQ
jgi:hypothetical protein